MAGGSADALPRCGTDLSGGRTWWAHFEFAPINIEPTILRKKIEDQLIVGAFCVDSRDGSLRKSPEVSPTVSSLKAYTRRACSAGRAMLALVSTFRKTATKADQYHPAIGHRTRTI